MRPDAAVRRTRAPPATPTATGASRCSASRATSSPARSQARRKRSSTSAGDLRRDLPDDREAGSQRTSPPSAVPAPDRVPDADGDAGEIEWNFEKFLVAPTARCWPGSGRRSNPRTTQLVERSRRRCRDDDDRGNRRAIGDRLRTRTGRRAHRHPNRSRASSAATEMLAFVEDSDEQWLKMPAPQDGQVPELVSRGSAIARTAGVVRDQMRG